MLFLSKTLFPVSDVRIFFHAQFIQFFENIEVHISGCISSNHVYMIGAKLFPERGQTRFQKKNYTVFDEIQ